MKILIITDEVIVCAILSSNCLLCSDALYLYFIVFVFECIVFAYVIKIVVLFNENFIYAANQIKKIRYENYLKLLYINDNF